jgi:hypothetical protein
LDVALEVLCGFASRLAVRGASSAIPQPTRQVAAGAIRLEVLPVVVPDALAVAVRGAVIVALEVAFTAAFSVALTAAFRVASGAALCSAFGEQTTL